MSYETSAQGNVWTHSASGKGGRRSCVKKGVYVIDHRDTGLFIVGSSNSVSDEVDKQLGLLGKGKHPVKRLQSQYDHEIQRSDKPISTATLTITEFSLSSDRLIKTVLNEIRSSNTTPYCLLN